ncbi:MAG: hypothetical protein QOF76_3478, partial [Solirubrobacteraceae bacterium]|nr:hypothetical protein [Solirubrobacteraceae bacterium]
AISRDGKTLWAANHSTGNVSVIDTATAAVVKTITVGAQPLGLALTPDGTKLYVGNGKDCTISVIDTAAETAGPAPIALPAAACSATPQGFFGDPGRMAMSPDGTTLYAASLDAQLVTPVDTATGTPGTPISFTGVTTPTGLPFRPGALAFTPDGARLLVADAGGGPSNQFGNTVQIVSTPANTLSGTPIALNSALGTGNDAAVTPDQAPVAAFTVTSAAPGAATSFDASTSTVRFGTIASYAWDFGDGAKTTTATPATTHVYTAAGTYSATVTETDATGTSLPVTTLMTGRTLVRHGSDSARATRSVVVAAGPQPAVSLSAATLDFGEAALGTTTAAKTVTVTNSGAAPLSIASATIGGSDFAIGADGCSGKPVAAGASCAVGVTFTPGAGGQRTGQLAFADDASGSPHTVALGGVGTTVGSVTGTVRRDSDTGAPIANAPVYVCGPVGPYDCRSSLTDAAGHYAAPGLQAGRYAVTANAPAGLWPATRVVDVAAGPATVADFALTPPVPLPKGISVTGAGGNITSGTPVMRQGPFTITLPISAFPAQFPDRTAGTVGHVTVSLKITGGSSLTVPGGVLIDSSGEYRVISTEDGRRAARIAGVGHTHAVAIAAAGETGGAGMVTYSSTPDGKAFQISVDAPVGYIHGPTVTTIGLATSLHPVTRSYRDCPVSPEQQALQDQIDDLQRQDNEAYEAEKKLRPSYTDALLKANDSSLDPEDRAFYKAKAERLNKQILELIQKDFDLAKKIKDLVKQRDAQQAKDCPLDNPGPDDNIFSDPFDNYFDPSGNVLTPAGVPLLGAKVVLVRSDAKPGPFTAVPNGSTIMSPSNRQNPDRTDATGYFGWDVQAGFYKVTASHAGCHAPGKPKQRTVSSKAGQVPPPIFNLKLRLTCAHAKKRSATLTEVESRLNGSHGFLLTARVKPVRHAKHRPLGTVTFTRKGRTVATVALNPRTGVATTALTSAAVKARYSGDARFAGSRSR